MSVPIFQMATHLCVPRETDQVLWENIHAICINTFAYRAFTLPSHPSKLQALVFITLKCDLGRAGESEKPEVGS